MATPVAGTEGRVTIGGAVIYLSKWNIKFSAVDLDSTNYESNGYEEGITGKKVANVTASGFWDADQAPHGVPNLKAGEILANVHLYVRKTGNRRYEFPLFRCLEVTPDSVVDGKVELSFSGKSNGTWTYAS